MKKIALFFCVCLFAISVQAQEPTTHLKFMGIELNGSITEFQTKLLGKGLTISKMNNQYPTGIRVYDGIFSGEKANILVWYNPRSKQVYRAKAIISREGKDLIEQLKTSFENKLDLKYGEDSKTTNSFKDEYLHEFDQHSYSVGNGMIDLFIGSTSYISQSTFYLHIDYKDLINYAKNTADEMDDL